MLRLRFYRSDGWRWQLTASNGHVLAASTAGYSQLADCKRNAHRTTRYRLRPLIRTSTQG